MESQTTSNRVSQGVRDIRIEYIRGDKYETRVITIEQHTLCYVLKGSCTVNYGNMLREASENDIYVLERGEHTIDMRPSSDGGFELLMIRIPNEAVPHRSDVSRLEREVLAAVSEQVTIEELASRCCVSLSTFKRHFRSRYSMSPHRWFLSQRLKMAYRMVLDTNMSMQEISAKCGFGSSTHFATLFKRHYGTPPCELRRKSRSR